MESTTLALDIGDNATKLLEKLATQIGATADKVFPWLVKQQVLEGWMFFGISSLIFVLAVMSLSLGVYFIVKEEEVGIGFVFFGGVVFILVLLAIASRASGAATQILNPEYHALKEAARLVGQMTGK